MQVVGVDIASDSFVAFHPLVHKAQSFANTAQGFKGFQSWLQRSVPSWLPGNSLAQEAKWAALGKRLISKPIEANR